MAFWALTPREYEALLRVHQAARGIKPAPTPDELKRQRNNQLYIANGLARAREKLAEERRLKLVERQKARAGNG